MPSVIKIKGRVFAATRDYRSDYDRAGSAKALAPNERPDGRKCDGTPIPASSADSPYRAGIPFVDTHDDVVYRVVHRLNISEGWGTAHFWMKRWGCMYSDILGFVRLGWLDAAIEEGSSVKRFRCRDEHRVLASLQEREARRSAIAAERSAKRQAKPPVKPRSIYQKGRDR